MEVPFSGSGIMSSGAVVSGVVTAGVVTSGMVVSGAVTAGSVTSGVVVTDGVSDVVSGGMACVSVTLSVVLSSEELLSDGSVPGVSLSSAALLEFAGSFDSVSLGVEATLPPLLSFGVEEETASLQLPKVTLSAIKQRSTTSMIPIFFIKSPFWGGFRVFCKKTHENRLHKS